MGVIGTCRQNTTMYISNRIRVTVTSTWAYTAALPGSRACRPRRVRTPLYLLDIMRMPLRASAPPGQLQSQVSQQLVIMIPSSALHPLLASAHLLSARRFSEIVGLKPPSKDARPDVRIRTFPTYMFVYTDYILTDPSVHSRAPTGPHTQYQARPCVAAELHRECATPTECTPRQACTILLRARCTRQPCRAQRRDDRQRESVR